MQTQSWHVRNAGTATTPTTNHANPFSFNDWATGEVNTRGRVAASLRLKNLKIVREDNGPGPGITATYRFRKNGADTPLFVSMSGTTQEARNTADVADYSEGDWISIQVVFAVTTGAPLASDIHLSYDIEIEGETISHYGAMFGTALSTTLQTWGNPFGFRNTLDSGTLTDISEASSVWPLDGTITAMRVDFETAPGAGDSYIMSWYKNEVAQDGGVGTVDTRITIADTATTVAGSYSLPVTAGDRLSISFQPTGAPTTPAFPGVCFVFVAATEGEYVLGASSPTNNVSNTVSNYSGNGLSNLAQTWLGTEADRRNICGISPITIRALIVRASAANDGRVVAVRKNGADEGPLVTFSGGGVAFSDDSFSVTLTDGDYFGVRTSGDGSVIVHYSFGLGEILEEPDEPPQEPPGLDGDVDPSDGPFVGTLPVNPMLFALIRLTDGSWLKYSEGGKQFNDPDTWYQGKKQSRIWGATKVKRKFALDGGLEVYQWSLLLDDRDGALRVAALNSTLKNAEVYQYWVDDDVRRAFGDPYRIAAGIVVEHDPDGDNHYELRCESILGHRLTRKNSASIVPPYRLTSEPNVPGSIPGLDSALEGSYAQVMFGAFEDDGVPWRFIGGPLNLQDFFGGSAPDVDVDVYLISMGAVGLISGNKYRPPAWEANDETVQVGDLVRPNDFMGRLFVCINAGTTGEKEPIWPLTGTVLDISEHPDEEDQGGVVWQVHSTITSDDVRIDVPESAYGTVLAVPFKPGWALATGNYPNQFIDYGGNRFTIAFFLRSYHLSEKLRTGAVILSAIGYGLTETANAGRLNLDDPSDDVITDPGRLIQFIIQQQIFNRSTWVTYEPMPVFQSPDGDYEYFDNDSVEAARLRSIAFLNNEHAYRCALLLARDGSSQRGFDVIREIQQGTGILLGENRHGQGMVHYPYTMSAPDIHYDGREILKNGFKPFIYHDRFANQFTYRAGYSYLPLPGKGAAQAKYGWNLTPLPFNDGLSQIAVDEVFSRHQDNMVVRELLTANDWAARQLDLWCAADQGLDGRRGLSITVRASGLGKVIDGTPYYVDLGTLVGVRHPRGFLVEDPDGVHGLEVWEIEIDPLGKTVRLAGPVLSLQGFQLELPLELTLSEGLSVGSALSGPGAGPGDFGVGRFGGGGGVSF